MLPQGEVLQVARWCRQGVTIVGFQFCVPSPHFGDEQFWGRVARASCDPLGPGRFLFGAGPAPKGASNSELTAFAKQVAEKVVEGQMARLRR
jgi:hypothetical protein